MCVCVCVCVFVVVCECVCVSVCVCVTSHCLENFLRPPFVMADGTQGVFVCLCAYV